MTQSKTRPDFATILLLALLLAMAAYTLSSSEWAPGLEMLQPTSLAALLLGVLLTRTAFRPLVTHLLALGYGAVWIVFIAFNYLPRAAGAHGLGEQVIALGRHIAEWIWLLVYTGVGRDNFMFLLALLIVLWLLGYFAAWYTFRVVRVFRVVLLPGLVIMVNLYYYGGAAELSIFLYLFFVFTLLYLVRVHFMLREQAWRQARVGYDDDVRSAFVRGGSVVALFAVFIAWAVPEVAPMPQFEDLWRQVSRPIRSIEDSFNRLFSALQGEGPALTNPFGRTLGFGGPRNLGDQVLMDVLVEKSQDNASALARYWRAGTYDTYTSGGWTNSDTDAFIFSPRADELATPYLLRSNVKQTFTFYFPRTSLLIAAAQPVYFNRDAEAVAEVSTSGEPGADQTVIDTSFVQSRDLLRAGDSYEVISSLSIADIGSLRQSGVDYPAWIAERYLQLPDNFPQRVKDLAGQIAAEANATNPFDQATALERWLRGNITYNDQIEGPQPGRDGVDYLLFESRAGYCDYYAAALVTMARSLGIPARVAIGYARGEANAASGTFRVRERDAHSWVEVYFANYGWVEFEPTSAQPLISRPVPVEDPNQPDSDPAALADAANELDRLSRLGEDEGIPPESSEFVPDLIRRSLPMGLLILGGLLGLGTVVAVGAIYVVENYGLRGLRGTRLAFARLMRLAPWLRVDLRAHQTPYEQAALLDVAAPASQPAIDLIADDFVRETFGRENGAGDRAVSIWRQTHIQLWWAGLKRRRLSRLRFPRRGR